MCRTDFPDAQRPPETIKVPRPLRDLLATSADGLAAASLRAWVATAAAPGEWVQVDLPTLLGGARPTAVRDLKLRSQGNHLHMRVELKSASAMAIGRRVTLVAPCTNLPDVLSMSLAGRPVSQLVSVPFLTDPAVTIQRIIHRDGEEQIDVRCRCPSHQIRLPTAN
jgi:hypothetical protein